MMTSTLHKLGEFRRPLAIASLATAALFALPGQHARGLAAEPAVTGEEHAAAEDDPHAHHRRLLKQPGYRRTVHDYTIPDVRLITAQGDEVPLSSELEPDEPVMVTFIFTTCTTICPVLSATFSAARGLLEGEKVKPRMVSISIDPEYDTPARLQDYAQRYKAGPGWRFLTGDLDAIIAVQRAFDAYRGDKMSHEPLTFLRASPEEPWVRIEGFASAADLVEEYRGLVVQ
jgi:protein SCO1/2